MPVTSIECVVIAEADNGGRFLVEKNGDCVLNHLSSKLEAGFDGEAACGL